MSPCCIITTGLPGFGIRKHAICSPSAVSTVWRSNGISKYAAVPSIVRKVITGKSYIL